MRRAERVRPTGDEGAVPARCAEGGRAHLRLLTLLFFTGLMGCGPIIGDPCTVNTECGKGVCMNADFAPGGLCTLNCAGGAVCPAGSTCVERVIDRDTPGCLLACAKDSDCRTGYVCRVERESRTAVCVGTAGVP